MLRYFSALIFTGSVLFAQQVQHSSLGFVLDNNASRVRPIGGVPGAALIGSPIDLGADIAALAGSPNQDYFISISASGNAAIWQRSTGASQPLANVAPGAGQVVLSPEGGAAAFYYPSSNTLSVVKGLPAAPVPVFSTTLDALFNPAYQFAVADDASLVLISESAVFGNPAPAVVAISMAGIPSRIPLAGPATSIAFLSNSHDALLSSFPEAVLIRDAAQQTARIPLPEAAMGAVGSIASTDGSRGYFAGSNGIVSILNLTNLAAAPVTLDCQCTPTGIYRTAAPSVYRLNDFSTGSISLVDASTSQPHSLVIPPSAALVTK